MSKRLPDPDEVRSAFARLFADDPEKATAYLYDLGVASGYIETEAVGRNICWTSESAYGTLECTINLSKPEKDPRAIAEAAASPAESAAAPATAFAGSAAAGAHDAVADATGAENRIPSACSSSDSAPVRSVPRCDLCWENEGFAGSPEHPAKPGLRIAAIELGGERWGLQYSPYAYVPEHCIALSEKHRPMRIAAACFERLLDFADAFPFYFIGSNADLPIVGGSILSHDHFQGGRHTFPLMKAPVERDVALEAFPDVRCGIVRWPASVLRLESADRASLCCAAARILRAWQSFSHDACAIASHSPNPSKDGCAVPHNTLNPIVRKTGATYTMDLVLRNNRTDAGHPWGIFHPGDELHHIKKENIGLIEIMGLAILPARLARELPAVQRELVRAARKNRSVAWVQAKLLEQEATAPHASWAADVYARRAAEFLDAGEKSDSEGSTDGFPEPTRRLSPPMQEEVGRVFETILETTGVFKRDETGAAGWNALIEAIRRTDSPRS